MSESVEETKALSAINKVRKHLQSYWICEGCDGDAAVDGCWSCKAVLADKALAEFEVELREQQEYDPVHGAERKGEKL